MGILNTIWTYVLLFRDLFLGTTFLLVANLLPPLQPGRKDLTGQTAVVTGSNSGVGYGVAFDLARQGAMVVLACRNEVKAAKARTSIISSLPNAKVDIIPVDTASFDSVRAFAKACKEKYSHIDILVHNAGISAPPEGQDFTPDGFEIMYQTNFLSSFLLTHLLEAHLSDTARVIFTSSIGSFFGRILNNFSLSRMTNEIEGNFHAFGAGNRSITRYSQSKLMQAAFAKRLQTHFDAQPGNCKLAFSFEPGLVKTNIFDAIRDPFWKDPAFGLLARLVNVTGIEIKQGAATAVHLAMTDRKDVLADRGRYFDRMRARTHWIDTMSREKLDRLWIRWCADCEISWV